MKKKIILAVFLFAFSGVLIIANLFFSLETEKALLSSVVGTISFFLLPNPHIVIHSPENTTYDFTQGDYLSNNMILDLNVSAVYFYPDLWWYKHEDLRHGVVVNDSVAFAPNATINAVRWGNRLTVFALNSTSGLERSRSVEFYVSVPNSAPLLNIQDEIIACEGKQLNYLFSATDIDEDHLNFGINPVDPFFLAGINEPLSEIISPGVTYAESEIISDLLTKEHSGRNGWNNYLENISVWDDGTPSYSDYKLVNITVIEINNAPTIWIENETIEIEESSEVFFFGINVSDSEDGNQGSGNFSFNLTFLSGEEFFDVNNFGEFNFTPVNSLIGEHEIQVCAIDNGLEIAHQNISLCGTGENQSACLFFNITITGEQIIIPPSFGGGGGGGGGGAPTIERCKAEWVCYDWNECENAELSLELGLLIGEEFREINDECIRRRFLGRDCGFQERRCFDINACGEEGKPTEMQACQFVEDPSCFDGIKNCHDGSCEFLVDCGGPCVACATCSDGIQNQGEHGVDCGGPCPIQCIEETPSKSITIYLIFGIIIVVLLIVLIIRVRAFLNLDRKG